MFSIGETVMYKSEGACTIAETVEKEFAGQKTEYYVLHPVFKPSATIYVPLDNELLVSRMKPILSKSEAQQTFDTALEKKTAWIDNVEERKLFYKKAFESTDRSKLVSAVRMVRAYRDSSDKSSKKPHVFDLQFMRDAERNLTEEFSLTLGKTSEEIQEYLDRE